LGKLTLLSSLAIVLHSVPEGLGVCVAAATGTEAGFVVAIALAVHKLFEGIIVGVPQFYASGSRAKAFAWVALAACANPLGGLMAVWAMANNGLPSDSSFGVIYGCVGGLMTWIALGELLPAARNEDPQDRVTSKCLVAGMVSMTLTLVLLAFVGSP
jgi:ZIP family zinc transporter